MSNNTRAEAKALIEDGWRVWPLRGKFPTKAGFSRADGPDACASLDDFDAPDVDVAVLCGPCPAAGPGARFVLVDYDGPVPRDQRVGGAPTLTSKDGAHEWYRVPPGVTGFRQTTRLRSGEGWAVDTRDFGGYGKETAAGQPLWDDGPVSWPRDLTQAEVDRLFPVAAAPEPRPEYAPPARVTRPSQAATNALATRWHTNPEGTNRLAGAVGAILGGEWGWEDDAIREYFDTWLQHSDPRHVGSALRAAARRRAGDRIQGFPTLAAEGVDFAPDVPAAQDELWDLLAAGPAEAQPATADAPAAPTLLGAKVWSARDIAAWDPPPIPWLSEQLCLAPGAPSLITGYGGSGKTTFVQHLAIAVATPGQKLLGEYPVRHGAVLHIDHEQGSDLTMRRYLRQGLTAGADLTLVSYPQWGLGNPDSASRLAFLRACEGKALVVIDSLLASCAAWLESGENDSTIREPLDFLGKVSAATGAVCLVIHHSKKDRSEPMTSARGSSAITDAVSAHIVYEKADLSAKTKPVLRLSKVRYEHPRGALTEPVTIGLSPRGVPADEGYTLVVSETAADARVGGLEEEITVLLASGWTGSVNQLVSELGRTPGRGRNRNDVYAAVKQLRASGVLSETGPLRLNSAE
jgi:hypothetical protein